jgi:hypothetical protein
VQRGGQSSGAAGPGVDLGRPPALLLGFALPSESDLAAATGLLAEAAG